ncbi:MAG TPA: DUF2461 domain-containing protein [Sphingobacterium sp.]|nr:DUF2461 domain-containing protein [Sphingobacterium sp.]
MRIKESTLKFLNELGHNNNREWFQANKNVYLAAHDDFKNFITKMIIGLAEFDPHINTDINATKCMFRIYRDVRFSKNKDPYKNWFAAGISIDGRKLEGPEYYIHIEPQNKSFIACGYWRPKKEHLDAIRQEIDYNFPQLIAALSEGQWTVDDLSKEDKLMRPPTGYTADDPNIETLKLKSFILYETLPDTLLMSNKALETVLVTCKRIYPFKKFLHEAIE